ncbi:AI-2E family transporter [Algoriphagus machipongonensis]|uniref:Permease n=1 Tax=Algoriphagus machipongonensis TaxID=388413 RepID=A3I055_9BACT|nr:AI-2E family transporter [Algoriphagus machipongonensis]EAZ79851.1 putative permease [Algoriphagus machipongonensis]
MKNQYLQNTVNLLLAIVLGAIILKEGDFILVPLVWGAFFAFALNPLSNWFELRRIPRGLSIFLSILLVSILFLGLMYLMLDQMIGLIGEFPKIGDSLMQKVGNYRNDLNELLGVQVPQFDSIFDTEAIEWSKVNETVFATGQSITLAGIIPLYIFLLMYYKDFFVEFLFKRSSESNVEVLNWAEETGKVIQHYLGGILKVSVIVALLAGLFFYLIGLKYFLLFAVFIALMNLIPYVGVFISSFFAILYVFLTTDTLFYPFITFLVLWGIQLLENNIITPLVVGAHVRVNALAVLLAILIGGWLWGISGMVLFIPLVGVLKITLERNSSLKAYAYLLGDDIPISEKNENFWKLFKKKLGGKK